MGTEQGNLGKDQRPAQRNPVPPPGGATARPAGEESKAPEGRHKLHGQTEDPEGMGLERIREILFGSTQRELERRLFRTDGQLAARSHELEQEARRRTEVLEAHFRKETESIAARLERGLADASEGLRRTGREHHDTLSGIEQRLAKIEETTAQVQRELRHQLLEQAKSFLDELQKLRKELFAALQEELGLAERDMVEELRESEEHPGH